MPRITEIKERYYNLYGIIKYSDITKQPIYGERDNFVASLSETNKLEVVGSIHIRANEEIQKKAYDRFNDGVATVLVNFPESIVRDTTFRTFLMENSKKYLRLTFCANKKETLNEIRNLKRFYNEAIKVIRE